MIFLEFTFASGDGHKLAGTPFTVNLSQVKSFNPTVSLGSAFEGANCAIVFDQTTTTSNNASSVKTSAKIAYVQETYDEVQALIKEAGGIVLSAGSDL